MGKAERGGGGGLFLRFMPAFCIPQRAPSLLKPLKVATIACIINQDRWYKQRRPLRSVALRRYIKASDIFYYVNYTDSDASQSASLFSRFFAIPSFPRNFLGVLSNFAPPWFCAVRLPSAPRVFESIHSEEGMLAYFGSQSEKTGSSHDICF